MNVTTVSQDSKKLGTIAPGGHRKRTTQKEHRQGINVGPGFNEVSPVRAWYDAGHFRNQDEAKGAFRLAYQQALDGMGVSTHQWMGLTDKEYDAWMKGESLPARRRR